MEDYDPPSPGYDPPTWQQKLEFQRSSFRPLEKQAYEEQLVAMDLKRFIVPFSRRGCAVPYKIERKRMAFLYARYRSRLRELKYVEDCWVERMNEGKLALPASPLPSFPGQDPSVWSHPKGYTDLGGSRPESEGFFPTWDARVKTARNSQMAAIREFQDWPHPTPPKKSALQIHHDKIRNQVLACTPKSKEQAECRQCW